MTDPTEREGQVAELGTTSGGQWIRRAGLAVFSTWLGLWIAAVIRNPNTLTPRDWVAFDRAADLVRAGMPDVVYSSAALTDLHFLYPPFALYLFAGLAWLPPMASYIALVVVMSGCLAAGLYSLMRAIETPRSCYGVVVAVTLASGAWIGTVVAGQISPIYVFAFAAGLLAWRLGRPFLAGLSLALLWLKPNLGLVVLGVLLIGRRWRVVVGMLAGLAGFVVASLPLGPSLWVEFVDASRTMTALIQTPSVRIERHIGVLALLAGGWPEGAGHGALRVIWIASIVPLGLALLEAWWRAPRSEPARLVAVTVLLIVAGNPYMYFYDALILVIPAAVWYVSRSTYASASRHRFCGVMLTIAFSWSYMLFFSALTLGVIGLAAYAWAAVELIDLRVGRLEPPPTPA